MIDENLKREAAPSPPTWGGSQTKLVLFNQADKFAARKRTPAHITEDTEKILLQKERFLKGSTVLEVS